jgi:predicted SpoU family rRNA methylase
MKKRTKRLLGGVALAAGAFGAAGAYLGNKKRKKRSPARRDVWARPGMEVTFRAELMPGRDRVERTFRVKELLPSGRVLLTGPAGEHAEKEFERVH